MAINYAETFESTLAQKYSQSLMTGDLGMNGAKWLNAQTINIPSITVSGYKEHSRAGGFNSGTVGNSFEPKVLAHDRDIEFFVDSMDVDETNQSLSAANVTNTFEEEQAIPETDAYRLSKIYFEYTDTYKKTASSKAVTAADILDLIDDWMAEMDDAEVPMEGRILYVTPTYAKLIKQAPQIVRNMNVGGNDTRINRIIDNLDNLKIVKVPASRMKTAYDFSDGFVPTSTAGQINMIMVHPKSVVAADKHSAIYLWEPGTHTKGDGWLYQNRKYGDLFLLKNRTDGVKIHYTPKSSS